MSKRHQIACAISLFVLSVGAIANAGNLNIPAEKAVVNSAWSATTGCVPYTKSGTNSSYKTMKCPVVGGSGRVFYLYGHYPADASAADQFKYKVHYETDNPNAAYAPAFVITGYALTTGANPDNEPVASGVTATGTNTETNGDRQITPYTSTTAIFQNDSGSACTVSACKNLDVKFKVELTSSYIAGTDSGYVYFRMLETVYP